MGCYRYGFNGMDKDDEVKGSGNSYTTMFRQYDPRLGRWLTIDPKNSELPQESPYISMGDNPINNTDVFGDKWKDKGDERKASKMKIAINDRIEVIDKRIEALNNIQNLTEAQSKEFSELGAMRKEMTDALDEIEVLGNPDNEQEYTFVASEKLGGRTNYDPKSGVVRIEYNVNDFTGTAIHELKHAYQFELGKIDFRGLNNEKLWGPGITYDLTDEEEAYRRQYAFKPSIFAAEGITNINQVKTGWISNITVNNKKPYGNLPTSSIAIQNSLFQYYQVTGYKLLNDEAWKTDMKYSTTIGDILKILNEEKSPNSENFKFK